MTTLSKKAEETTVFVVRNNEIEYLSLYSHIMSFEDLTTSPIGICNRLFIEEIEIELFDEDDCYVGVRMLYDVCTWGINGNNRRKLSFESHENREDAEQELFEIHYSGYYQNTCDSTHYYQSHEDAVDSIIEDYCYLYDISEATARSVYSKQLLINSRLVEIAEEKRELRLKQQEETLKNRPVAIAKIIDFIKENKELVDFKKSELDELKEAGEKSEWQVKANSLIQIVSKNDFSLGWKEIYTLIKNN